MKKLPALSLLLLCLLIVSACSKANKDDVTALDESGGSGESSPVEEMDSEKGESTSEVKESNDEEIDMLSYFLPDGSQAHYEGVGNEFAEFNIDVTYLPDSIVMVHENNGGVLLRKIFRVEQDRILKLDESPVQVEDDVPSAEELGKMEVNGVYLQKPFEKGATFERWTIAETDATVETPYRTFDNVIVLEEEDKDFVNRKYFAEGFGEVKRESVMVTSDQDDFVVTSSLEAVTKPN